MYYKLVLIILLVPVYSCDKDVAPMVPTVVEPLDKISIDQSGFVDASGEAFFPWGLNYTNTEHGLIEDDWLSVDTWAAIRKDFEDMSGLGANVVRIHLQYHKFMIDAENANQAALDRLVDFVAMAEEVGLYLNITGLASYRKDAAPEWYINLDDNQRWSTQKLFWQNVAGAINGSPAVFAYNLMNEPVVAVGCVIADACSWLPGNGFGGFHFVQNVSRDPAKPFLETMQSWMAEMTNAIRTQDVETPITVGLLALGAATRFADDLDYLSPHIYPKSGELNKSVQYVQDNQSNVPLVIEEISNLNCTAEELQEFVDQIDGLYDGLMGHYHGKNFSELNRSNINDALQYNFLKFFQRNSPKAE